MRNEIKFLFPGALRIHFCHNEHLLRSPLKTQDSSTIFHNYKYKNNDGITLVEVVISIGLLGAVVVPLMTLFVMSAKINKESNKEFKSLLTAQKYIEEIKAMDTIDAENYIYNDEDGCYERTIIQVEDEYGAEIKIIPIQDPLYEIEIIITDDGEIINSLTASKIAQ